MEQNHLERVAKQILGQTGNQHADPFEMSLARVYAVSAGNTLRPLVMTPDIYAGIASIPCMHDTIGDDPLVALETCGFAAPSDNTNVSPSVHPRRRRVRMVLVANRQGDIGSAIEFADDPGNAITSPDGQGMLAEELSEAMRRLELVQSLPPTHLRSDDGS